MVSRRSFELNDAIAFASSTSLARLVPLRRHARHNPHVQFRQLSQAERMKIRGSSLSERLKPTAAHPARRHLRRRPRLRPLACQSRALSSTAHACSEAR